LSEGFSKITSNVLIINWILLLKHIKSLPFWSSVLLHFLSKIAKKGWQLSLYEISSVYINLDENTGLNFGA
jgi:hypothetical protein